MIQNSKEQEQNCQHVSREQHRSGHPLPEFHSSGRAPDPDPGVACDTGARNHPTDTVGVIQLFCSRFLL